jgi:hypothetical protein
MYTPFERDLISGLAGSPLKGCIVSFLEFIVKAMERKREEKGGYLGIRLGEKTL